MKHTDKIELTITNTENLLAYCEILQKSQNLIINEALEEYFSAQNKRLSEKNQNDESVLTNLNYDEFWDGVEL